MKQSIIHQQKQNTKHKTNKAQRKPRKIKHHQSKKNTTQDKTKQTNSKHTN